MNKKIKPAIAVIVLIFLVAMIGLLSHVIMKRIPTKEKMNLNEYMSVKFPEAFMAAERICRQMEKSLKLPIPDIEIGYLAMHLERMLDTDINE